MTLQTARIIGFFSIPSPSLAEHNPQAYAEAMREIPANAGTCSHCGTGIVHHVVIVDDTGKTRFIGTTCAEKVGCDPEQIRYHMTDEEKAKRDAERAQRREVAEIRYQERMAEKRMLIVKRREVVGDIVDMLNRLGEDFYSSLATQLEERPLSQRQAFFVAKATSSTGRRNKKNAEAWDAIEEKCMMEI